MVTLTHTLPLGAREAPASALFLAWRPGAGFLPPDGRLENPRRGLRRPRDADVDAQVTGGRSPDARGATAHRLLSRLGPRGPTVEETGRARECVQGTLEGTPRWGWDCNPALGCLCSGSLSSFQEERAFLEVTRCSTEHPSQRWQREDGPGVHLPPEERSLCFQACSCGAEWKYLRLCSVAASDSLPPRGLKPARLLCPWDFPGKNPGVGCHFLLQGIFLIQGSNSPLLPSRTGRWMPYH